jgi:hypothetical protein
VKHPPTYTDSNFLTIIDKLRNICTSAMKIFYFCIYVILESSQQIEVMWAKIF